MRGVRREKPKKRGKFMFFLLVSLALLAVDLYLSNFTLRGEEVTIKPPRLPPALDGFKIAHLSDTHQRSWGKNNAELLEMLIEASPDIIAITGDMIDSPKHIPWAVNLAMQLSDIAPVYYVTGNHEWDAEFKGKTAKGLISELKKIDGVFVMENTYSSIEGVPGAFIAGIGDPKGPFDQKTLPEVVDSIHNIDAFPFIIMLSHRYERLTEYAEMKLDVVLTGHAHGGLVRLPFTDGLIGPGRVFFPKNTNMDVISGNTIMVVSRGMGGSPRLFNRCHVVIITLER